jgi:hypothetical protein
VFWKVTPTGHFTVKSAYALAQKQSGSLDFSSSLKAGTEKGVWHKLWCLHVPGKVQHFLWRTCQEVLPIRYNLHKRHITKEALCVFCSQVEETMTHVLWACPFANSVWSLMGRRLQKCTISSEEFFLITSHIMALLLRHEVELWATTGWAFWNTRNNWLWRTSKLVQRQSLIVVVGFWRTSTKLRHSALYCNHNVIGFCYCSRLRSCCCSMFLPHRMGVSFWWFHVDTPLPECRAHSLVPPSISVFVAFLK